jgi:D-alanyl-lipoteichoic acid acyltransferase DltB (MBOAT superfamily)
MLFNTYTYAVFLVLVFVLYQGLPLRGRQLMLVAASYLFYCWETPIYGLLLVASTLLDYTAGRLLGATAKPHLRKWILTGSLTGNLCMLGFFKYADFFRANAYGLANLMGLDVTFIPYGFLLPVGISFYTFQTMSYAIQVYRRQITPCHDFVAFALYVSFFPQLVAGPIERADHLLPQLCIQHRTKLNDIRAGLTQIVFGLFRKLVLADRLAILADAFYENPDGFSTPTAWVAIFCFIWQIYFDFSGYSEIAIGSARLFGVQLSVNFRRPLMGSAVPDFWNRWHISLTSWLRDYIFTPLGGFRRGGLRALLNAWITLLICGLWHGASWHFVAWGAYGACLLTVYYSWRNIRKNLGQKARRRPSGSPFNIVHLLCIALTFFTTMISGVFFRATSLENLGHVFKALLGLHAGSALPTQWMIWPFVAILASATVVEFCQEHLNLNERIHRTPGWFRALGMGVVIVVLILAGVNNDTPYIYFQF